MLDGARIAWRNLWRNRRRTLLLSSAVAFAMLLVVFAQALQQGSYAQMRDTATSLLTGQLQLQAEGYQDDPKPRRTVPDALALAQTLRQRDDVVDAATRLMVYALVSLDERSFAAQLVGTEFAHEQQVTRILQMAQPPLSGASEEYDADDPAAVAPLVLGSRLAANLGAAVGDELVLLGTGRDGGVAVMIGQVRSLVSTGTAELDRGLILAPLAAVRGAFEYGDEAHQLAVRAESLTVAEDIARELAPQLPTGVVALAWHELLPDLKQAIDIDQLSAQLFYYLLLGIVAFSVLNAFVMIFFERTREFGLLSALGMRRGSIQALLHWEALFLWLLGAMIGFAVLLPLLFWLARSGLYLGEQMEAYGANFYMPSRLYPATDLKLLAGTPLLLLVGVQIAVLIAAARIWRLHPVEALRAS